MSENKTTTSLNTIKTWFKTGLKPTQAHFWAWLDSFWHKDEEIPQDKITGLAETLENKAETSDLEFKANANATGLSEEQKQAWKEVLEVGELPTNIALIDERGDNGNKLGNVYTKIKSDELLREKLDKPTQTATTTEAPFVVGVNKDNESYKLPAGDLGKNMSNTDLNITQPRRHSMAVGSSLEFATGGNPFVVSGLQDKTTERDFNKIVKVDSRGILGLGEAYIFNFPNQITVSNTGISNIPEVSQLAQRFGERLREAHSLPKSKFSNWTIKTHNDISHSNIRVENQNTIYTTVEPFSESSYGTLITNIRSERVLPMDKDWLVRFNVKLGHSGVLHYNQAGNVTARNIGLYSSASQGMIEPNIYVYDGGGDYGMNSLSLLSSGKGKRFSQRNYNNTDDTINTSNPEAVISISIMKVGDVVLLQGQYSNTGLSEVYSAQTMGSGDWSFCVSVSRPQSIKNTIGVVSDVEYVILD